MADTFPGSVHSVLPHSTEHSPGAWLLVARRQSPQKELGLCGDDWTQAGKVQKEL